MFFLTNKFITVNVIIWEMTFIPKPTANEILKDF